MYIIQYVQYVQRVQLHHMSNANDLFLSCVFITVVLFVVNQFAATDKFCDNSNVINMLSISIKFLFSMYLRQRQPSRMFRIEVHDSSYHL